MAALAGILKEQGHQVTGSDEHVYPPMSTLLEGLGIPLQNGYRPENLTPTPDLVVVGNVIRRDNPEAQAVLAQNLPRLSLPEALNRFLVGDRQSLVVAGTHGKTTTTALIAWLLFALGLDPGFMVGASPRISRPITGWAGAATWSWKATSTTPPFSTSAPSSSILTPGRRCSPPSSSTTPTSTRTWTYHPGLRDFPGHIAPGGRVLAWGDAPLVREVCGRTTPHLLLWA